MLQELGVAAIAGEARRSRRIAVRMAAAYDLDISSVALDMTSFIGSASGKAPIAQRGKAPGQGREETG
jgi:hypothetical protein